MIEDWIDRLAEVWQIDTGQNKTVKSLKLYEKAEMPEKISPVDFPLAMPREVQLNDIDYAVAGAVAMWEGMTEFHLAPNCARSHLPYVLAFEKKILVAAAAHLKLFSLVKEFKLSGARGPAIQFTSLQYGDEAEHWGLLVRWVVYEDVLSQIAVSP